MSGSNPGRGFFAQHHDMAEGPGICNDIRADTFAHPLPSRIQHSSAAQDQVPGPQLVRTGGAHGARLYAENSQLSSCATLRTLGSGTVASRFHCSCLSDQPM